MPNCSFCDATEQQETPLCQSCGALRYPVANISSTSPSKLKISAAIAVAVFTPGSFVVLALVGVNKLNSKLRTVKR